MKNILRDTLQQMKDGEVQLVAASLSFSTAIALVPFIAVVLATFQSIGGLEALYPKVEMFLLRNMREAAGSDVTKFIRIFLQNIKTGYYLGKIVGCQMNIRRISECWNQQMNISLIIKNIMLFGQCMEWVCQMKS